MSEIFRYVRAILKCPLSAILECPLLAPCLDRLKKLSLGKELTNDNKRTIHYEQRRN